MLRFGRLLGSGDRKFADRLEMPPCSFSIILNLGPHFPVALIRTATAPALTITSPLTAIAAKYRCADRIRDLAAIQRATRECLPECAVRRQFYERGLFAPVVARVGLRNHGARTRNDFWRNRRRRLHARHSGSDASSALASQGRETRIPPDERIACQLAKVPYPLRSHRKVIISTTTLSTGTLLQHLSMISIDLSAAI